jgi:hypothetical protein
MFKTLVLGVIIEQNAMQAFGINFLVTLVELFFPIFMVLTFWQFLGTNVLWQDFACTDLSQMDKASIIGDAVNYVQELRKEVEELELAESLNVESECCGSVGDDSGSIITDTTGPEDAVMTVINGSYTYEAKAAAADSTNQKSPNITTEKNSPSQVHSVKKKILHVGFLFYNIHVHRNLFLRVLYICHQCVLILNTKWCYFGVLFSGGGCKIGG